MMRCYLWPVPIGLDTAAPPFRMKFDFIICCGLQLLWRETEEALFLCVLFSPESAGFLSVVALFFFCLNWLSLFAFVMFYLELLCCL